jgi:hypothetical protein
MNKDQVEKSLRFGGTTPILREKMGNYDLYISDGFSQPPHLSYQKFGVDPGEFPAGMFVTFWWLGKDEKLHIGRPLFISISEYDQQTRINAARKDAKKAMQNLRKH